MDLQIRPARKEDSRRIKWIVQSAFINPLNLNWQNFTVAEFNGRIVGVRQVKQHRDGTREVSSGVVLKEFRRKGVSARLMMEILRKETTILYLLCDEQWAHYYEQFGFKKTPVDDLPKSLWFEFNVLRFVILLLSRCLLKRYVVVPMLRPAQEQECLGAEQMSIPGWEQEEVLA